ncbi:MAG: hypothetical protein RI897_4512 [Verrucomicrobiota bacterium]
MCSEEVGPAGGEATGKEEVTGFGGAGGVEFGAGEESADFLEGAGESVRVAGELDGGGVGEELPLSGDGALDEATGENADTTDGDEAEAEEGEGVFAAAGSEEDTADHGEAEQAEEDAHEADIEAHVSVEDMAEFVGDDALEFIAGELLQAALGDADDGIVGRIAGGEGVDGLFIGEHVDFGDGDAGGYGHFLDDIAEAFFGFIAWLGGEADTAEGLGDDAATGGEFNDAVEAADADDSEGGCADDGEGLGLPEPVSEGGVLGVGGAEEDQDDEQVDGGDREEDCEREGHEEPAGEVAGFVLSGEEVHGDRCCVWPGDLLGEGDFGGGAFAGVFDCERFGGGEAEHAGDDIGGEDFAGGVIGHDRVVVGLAGEGDAVFRGGEFFHEAGHGLVGFEIGVGFGKGEEFSECTGESAFGANEGLDCGRVAGVGCGGFPGLGSLVTGVDDGFERLAFVLQVTFGGFDEVGDEVVAAFELDVDLGVGVFESVPEADEAVIDGDDDDGGDHDDAGQDEE